MGLVADKIITQMVIDKMIEIFGEDGIFNNEHHPKCFEYQIKIAKWMVDDERKSKESSPVTV